MVFSVCTPRLNSIAKSANFFPFISTIFCCLLLLAVSIALEENLEVVKNTPLVTPWTANEPIKFRMSGEPTEPSLNRFAWMYTDSKPSLSW